MKANYDYYNHRYYNYDYEDMNELSFSFDNSECMQMTSKVYPTKLEVRIDEDANRPYLYYEGVVHTNKGMCKIVFPKLEMALDCITATSSIQENCEDIIGRYRYMPRIRAYSMNTEFNNLDDSNVLYELQMFGEDDYKNMKEHFDRRWNE